ncbi:FHA domain-containing protein [Microbacterium sp. W1N]|uniref:FHA domain-containing protein n=1 Tax=Microbacterium festucae TaxID=2977531 RepID=UPI0021C0A368|nr:FHA domain-containing protein [Microbacterium festucae]MCT9820634.1 FHA domain-containing protein [Microbacterium festucae]
MIPPVTTVLLLGASVVVGLALYVWTALALSALFAKAGVSRGQAWVPVLNVWVLFVLAGLPGWWAIAIAALVIVGGVATAILGTTLAAAAVDASFGGDVAGAQSAATVATLVPALIWLVLLIPVVVLHVRMLLGIGRRLGFGAGYAVLGVVLFPVWASLAGWGSARWDEPAPAAPEPTTEAEAALPALAPFTPGAAPVAGMPAATFAPAPPAPAPAPLPGPEPEPVAAPPATGAWAPAAASPATAAAAGDDVDERTAIAPPRAAWRLEVPGAVVPLVADAVVLGRNPAAPAGVDGAQLVPIDDATRTVSKTHALLRRTGAGWTLVDLGSTNGVFLPGEREVTAPTPVTGAFFLGDAALALVGPS